MQTLEEVSKSTKTILLIDNELYVREILELCFKDLAGWNVVVADSLLEGIQKAEIERPDAIVIDICMHSMNCFQCMNDFRNNPKNQAIPVVLMSAAVRWLEPEFLRHNQIAGVISKPFNPLEIPVQTAKILGWDYVPIC
ncbi:response regulator [Calothrix sp. FACHB-1219]|uniref:response regulator n=1 Tax=unclassified Calothrix TaxID=2619626 RepID=UPI001682B0DA|nr:MULTISPECIES: response regulator [unclassified Calothrix]MBD2203526.1 response regulator [Calothrix sp. FACHB-168]MBD2219117.1 response regulator [Calothrix sp. FACHB-1219]